MVNPSHSSASEPAADDARAFLARTHWQSSGMQFMFAAESVNTPTDWQFNSPDHVLVVHRAGNLTTMEVEFERGPSGPALPRVGDVWLIPAQQRYAALAQGTSVQFCEIRIPTKDFEDRDVAATVQHRDLLALHLTQRMFRAATSSDPLEQMLCESLADAVRLQFLTTLTTPGLTSAVVRSPTAWDHATRAKVVEYFEDNLDGDITLSRLAKHFELSVTELTTQFKLTFRTTPHQYLVDRRIRRAKMLLTRTTKPITEIAHAVGFSTPSHFATTFRSRVGVTPTAYREYS
ncbi:helix-turn-helix transcriptional regulator [Mycolicibacterium septicum]|nr:helix-turn-helix transcriptional regulator [Mycolicibacterium septicum]